jgi:parallel beta-helix repeat protein
VFNVVALTSGHTTFGNLGSGFTIIAGTRSSRGILVTPWNGGPASPTIKVSGNTVLNSTQDGIDIYGVKNFSIIANRVSGSAATSASPRCPSPRQRDELAATR